MTALDLLGERNLPTLIRRQAMRIPDALAVDAGGRRRTYADLAADVDEMSASWPDPATSRGRVIAISTADPYRHWLAILAALGRGDCTVSVPNGADRWTETTAAFIAGDGGIESTGAGARVQHPPLPARLMRSSGTTGIQKTIALDLARLSRRLIGNRATYRLAADARTLAMNSPGTTSGLNLPILTWAEGGTVIFPKGRTPADVCAAVERSTVVLASPFALGAVVAKAEKSPLPDRTRSLFVAGARLSMALRDRAMATVCDRITIMYGAMEIGGGCRGDAALLSRHPGAVGRPRPGTELEIVDDGGNRLPPGVEGRIRMKSDLMVEHYWQDPDSTATNFHDGWFYPGDLGFIEPDGLVVVTGRTSETMNIGGAKLAPAFVEDALGVVPGVTDLCALAVTNAGGIDQLGIAVVAAPDGDWAAIEAAIRRSLRGLPSPVIFEVETLPTTETGKIDRRRLAADLTARLKQHVGKGH